MSNDNVFDDLLEMVRATLANHNTARAHTHVIDSQADATPIWERSVVTYDIPASVWLRRVDGLAHEEVGMSRFVGAYVDLPDRWHTGRQAFVVYPGSLFIGCNVRTDGEQIVMLYIYLPDDIWYPIGSPIERERGWHDLMQERIEPWLELSPRDRILRACADAQNELAPAAIDNVQDARAATAHFEEIYNRVAAYIVPVQPINLAEIANRIDEFIATLAQRYSVSVAEMADLFREVLGAPSNDRRIEPARTPRLEIENRQNRRIRIDRNRS